MVPEKVGGKPTGRLVEKTYRRGANIGQAGQAARLDLIAQVCESERPSKRSLMTAKQLATEQRKKGCREEGRSEVQNKVEELAQKVERKLAA